MATPDQHIELYGKLRARLLAQHFACSRYHRVNLLSMWNTLEPADSPGSSPDELDELTRWNANEHGRENPLAYSTHLFAFLAVEHALGHAKARPIINLALDAIGQLYKFLGTFGGYLTRWDALTTVQLERNDNPQDDKPPDVVRDFLVGPVGQYLYSIPATDPRHVPFRPDGILRNLKSGPQADAYEDLRGKYKERYRFSEVSMDEIAGLVGAYGIAFRLVDDADTRQRIKHQANMLGDYLAENGFLLVRPAGGFTLRGATGVLPAYELPVVNALADITGRDFSSRTDFMGALEKAGYARVLAGPIRAWEVGGLVLITGIGPAAVAPFLGFVLSAAGIFGILLSGPLVLGGAVLAAALTAIGTIVGPVNLLIAIAVFFHRDCFDVKDDDAAMEVAMAVLLKGPARRERFGLLFRAFSVGIGSSAVYHAPPLALSAVDGTDPTIGSHYWDMVATWRSTPPAADSLAAKVSENPFTSALALLHAGSASQTDRQTEEKKLVCLLNEYYHKLHDTYGSDLPLDPSTPPERTNIVEVHGDGDVSVIHYLGALALAWLYERRRRDAGSPVTTNEFPVAPTPAQFDAFPSPSVKGFVINRLPHVQEALSPTGVVNDTDEIDVFSDRVQTTRSAPLVPKLAPPPTNFLGEHTVTVRESDRDVWSGIELQDGDEYEITATGEIHAFGLAGPSGPDGWDPDQLVDDARWPLHTGLDPAARKFALLGCLGGYFVVGSNFPRRPFLFPWPVKLYLRINDDVSGDGSGEFQVTIRVWGEPRNIPGMIISCVTRDSRRRISGVGGVRSDGSRWFLPLDQAIDFAESGFHFMVGNARVEVRRSPSGRQFFRTVNDAQRGDNLGSLPACP